MGDEGRGTSSMSESNPSVLDPQTAALVRVAAAVARGKAPELNARFAAARDARVPGLWIEELLLQRDRKSTRLNSSHGYISYAVFCLKKKKKRLVEHLYQVFQST